MNLEDTEARNDFAGEGQQEFNRPTDRPTDQPNLFSREYEETWSHGLNVRRSQASNDVNIRGYCWEPLPGNHLCCSKKSSAIISESAIFLCSYEL
jgi:hypothetical protein